MDVYESHGGRFPLIPVGERPSGLVVVTKFSVLQGLKLRNLS